MTMVLKNKHTGNIIQFTLGSGSIKGVLDRYNERWVIIAINY